MIEHLTELKHYLNRTNNNISSLFRVTKPPKQDKYLSGFDSKFRELVAPDCIIEHWNNVFYRDKYHSIIGAKGYPGMVTHGWLYNLINDTNIESDFSQFIVPVGLDDSRTETQRFLNKCLTEVKLKEDDNQIVPESLLNKIKAARAKIKSLDEGLEKSFKNSIYIKTCASTENDLDKNVGTIISKLRGLMIIPSILTFQHKEAHECIMPIGVDTLDMGRSMDTTSTARSILLPGRARVDDITQDGTIIGVEYDTGIPIIFNRFDKRLHNFNIAVFAESGSGKTFQTSLDILHQIEIGNNVFVIDPKNDYSVLIAEAGGTVVEIKEGSDNIMNPYQLGKGHGNSLATKLQELPIFYKMLFGKDSITDAVAPIVSVCNQKIYADKGITDDPSTWIHEPPILSDFYYALEKYLDGTLMPKRQPTQNEIIAGHALWTKIEPFVTGPYKSFFNGQTTVDLSTDIISFNISNVPEMIRTPVMYQILSLSYNTMRETKRGFLTLYLDEAWELFSTNSDYIKKMVKTCRSADMSIYIITQDTADVTASSASNAVIGNTFMTILMRIKPAFKTQIKKMFDLTEDESDFITSCGKGEGIFIVGNTKVKFKTPSAPEEQDLIEKITDRQMEYVNETFDCGVDWYRNKDLTSNQVKILIGNGYEIVDGPVLGRGNAKYIIKNQTGNQGSDHYIMNRLIQEAAGNVDCTAKINDYGDECDMVITNNAGMSLGFEVETGTNNIKSLIKKTKRLNVLLDTSESKEKLYKWFFVCSAKDRRKYLDLHDDVITSGEVVHVLTKFNNGDTI